MSNSVSREQLLAMAGNALERDQRPVCTHNAATGFRIDLERVLHDSGIDIHKRKAEPDGSVVYEVDCLTSSEHDDGAYFISYPSGATHYGCHHESCKGKRWSDVRHLLKLPSAGKVTVNGKDTGKTGEPAAIGLKLRRASEIEPRDIEWLWRPWLPFGMLTLFAGYGGSGKSTTALAIAAACTVAGNLPDGSQAPLTNVLILAAEDSPEHTTIPRLIALGADLKRVLIVDGAVRDNGDPAWIQLRDHMPLLKARVEAENIGLVIIDPVSSYIGNANSDKESDVRSALMPVVQMAARTGAAVLAIRHVSKGGDSHRAASRILGSTAWHDVPRVAWMLADAPDAHQPEPNEDGTKDVRRVLGVVKSNIAAKPAARWGIQPADGPFQWLSDPSPVTVDECFRAVAHGGSKVQDAELWLKGRLAGGMERSSQVEQAAIDAGISRAAIKRARASLNVKARKQSSGEWWLSLPPQLLESDGVQEYKGLEPHKGEPLEPLETHPKQFTVNPLTPFPQPRGNTAFVSPRTKSSQGTQEVDAVQGDHSNEVEPLHKEASEMDEDWNKEI